LANIAIQTDIASGVKNADLVVEAATENEVLKLKIFSQVDSAASPDCILATIHPSISITKIASGNETCRISDRYAFYESGTDNETGGNNQRICYKKKRSRQLLLISQKLGKVPCVGK